MINGRESECLINEKPAVMENLVHFVNKTGSAKEGGMYFLSKVALWFLAHTPDGEKVQPGITKSQFYPHLA